ncbi:hypothetical protein KR76_15145 [Pimelobacter simplex]|uniref:Uncharacterized protein n=1 Tax=Nocardioides simplex TaxID=2045 RepID=A0A0A1DK84_NOCSI|nr:hypothetical protein KR76_15145 [Pimelobacter simplex]
MDEFNREFTRIASADEIDWLAFDLLTAAIHAHAFIWIGNPEVFEGDDRPSLYDPVEDEMAEEQEAEELGAESAD